MVKTKAIIQFIVGLAIILPFGLSGQMKIGYIDSNRIMADFEEVRTAQAKLEKQTRQFEAEYTGYLAQLDSLQRSFERQKLLLSAEKQQEKEAEMQQLYMATQQFQQQKFSPQGEIYLYQAQLMEPILKKVDDAVKIVGAAKGFDFIFDAGNSGLVYALPAYDITTEVIAELRRKK